LVPSGDIAAEVVPVADAAGVQDGVAVHVAVAVGAAAVVPAHHAALVEAGIAAAPADAADVEQRAGAERVVAVLLAVAVEVRLVAELARLLLGDHVVVVPALAVWRGLVAPAVPAVRVVEAALPALVGRQVGELLAIQVRLAVAQAVAVADVLKVAGGVVAVADAAPVRRRGAAVDAGAVFRTRRQKLSKR